MWAFSRLASKRPDLNLKFHLVGTVAPDSAVAAALLAKRSGGRILLHGIKSDLELRALAFRAHATVFVSLAEGYGLPRRRKPLARETLSLLERGIDR